MKQSLLFTLLLCAMAFCACNHFTASSPQPTEIFESTEGEQEGGYRRYFEDSRRAALGENWQNITQENLEKATQSILYPKDEDFAGGALKGDWYERGSSTVAGSTIATSFYPATEDIYAVTSSGTLIKGGLTGGSWSILNDFTNFNSNILTVVPISGGKRIITAKSDHKVYFSDDEGTTWTQAGGSIANAYSWGAGGKRMIVFNNGTLFYLQHVWLSSPDTWGSGYKLYRSTNNGATWSTVQTFNTRNENKVDMWSPLGSDELYVLDNGTTVYSLSGTASTLTTLSTNSTLTTAANYSFSGYKDAGSLNLYALVNSSTLYKSTDNGATWTNIAAISPTAWGVGMVANPWVTHGLYYGAVNFYKSTASTPSFTAQNNWGSYYGNIDLLHADMVSITPFQKTDGTKFFLIGNHGGIHYFPDPFTATINLTKTSIQNAEYYDVVTVGGSTIFAGAQDQGNQRFAGASGTNILTATQLISGDYVRLNTSVNATKYWQEYPFINTSGTFHYYDSPLTQTGTSAQTTIYGAQNVTAQQWVTPTCNYAIASENSILVGGGTANSSGSSGSHVIKLNYNGSSIVKTEYPFDFNNAGGGYITALDHAPADANYMYVGLNNGKFFYSHDAGTTWTQTASFTGPSSGYNYGSFVHASKLNKNTAFYAGGGGQVYKTTNGGVSFTNISSGLPNTFVNELVLNTSETLLFAATDAGPYVYVLSSGQWYSMLGTTAPVKSFTAVEYVAADNVVRFATFGRGVWDFKITSQPLPVTYRSFDAQETPHQQVKITWQTESEQDLDHFEVEKSTDGIQFSTLTQVKARNKGSNYAAWDNPLLEGINYYRIKSVDKSGKTEQTSIKSVAMAHKSKLVVVFPTTILRGGLLNVNTDVEKAQFYLIDNQGKVLMTQTMTHPTNQLAMPTVPSGLYHYVIRTNNNQIIKNGKLLLL
jgi:photosystem II stability/assembly factor-like uncharacterized protein